MYVAQAASLNVIGWRKLESENLVSALEQNVDRRVQYRVVEFPESSSNNLRNLPRGSGTPRMQLSLIRVMPRWYGVAGQTLSRVYRLYVPSDYYLLWTLGPRTHKQDLLWASLGHV